MYRDSHLFPCLQLCLRMSDEPGMQTPAACPLATFYCAAGMRLTVNGNPGTAYLVHRQRSLPTRPARPFRVETSFSTRSMSQSYRRATEISLRSIRRPARPPGGTAEATAAHQRPLRGLRGKRGTPASTCARGYFHTPRCAGWEGRAGRMRWFRGRDPGLQSCALRALKGKAPRHGGEEGRPHQRATAPGRHGRSAAFSRRTAVIVRECVTRAAGRLGSGHATRG